MIRSQEAIVQNEMSPYHGHVQSYESHCLWLETVSQSTVLVQTEDVHVSQSMNLSDFRDPVTASLNDSMRSAFEPNYDLL